MFRSAPNNKYGMIRNFLSLGNLLFRLRGVISITAIIILLTTFQGISESIDQRSPIPFFKAVGGQIFDHDAKLYVKSQEIIDEGGFIVETEKPTGIVAKIKSVWFVVKSIGGVFTNLWYMYFWGFIFFKISAYLFVRNTSDPLSAILLAIVFLAFFQVIFNFIVFDMGVATEYEDMTTLEKAIPFKGLVKFIQSTPYLLNPIYVSMGSNPTVPVVSAPVINSSVTMPSIPADTGNIVVV